jgi:hypothetical protein
MDDLRLEEQRALKDQAKALRVRARRLLRCKSVSDAYRESLLLEAEHRTYDEKMIGTMRVVNLTKTTEQPTIVPRTKVKVGAWRW